ncbi:MAG: exodeoxyribonuclease III [Limnospira sp. PMC 1291.21]|uniref:Exodeoxyribonuclease III n=2 Tax=Limnospira TaxID=2596745 RepID=B5VWM8_LIMMA|nr:MULTISPECIES: exodeoxyribonuclease III [Limnospira]EKD07766.1 exodeoxyribonuclease III [Arthrospira platensis C1]MDC0839297.1 exodeoxyribonuclease III [Limnoraphis robusta]MDY7053573.1 exodeoxyribonuclease III [Limnospira fusiformis LS22]QJB25481.1 exodeoxyribonuclease III [Limnospira fusiformis SAG 85.79]EDZ96254.1 exodeoxyribonuclease III [Limnospira maxima CS-328]
MKIATWNVNSIRTRQDQVLSWLQGQDIDVLCLQETKVIDQDFPRSPFEELGYHVYIYGQKAYNGVAIFSRLNIESVIMGFTPILGADQVGELDDQKRVIAGVIDDICIVNVYIPNGSSVGSDKYEYKLQWLNRLGDYLQQMLIKYPHLCICGDFNIAPEDRDIYNPQNRENHIMASAAERQALDAIANLGLADGFRKFTQDGGHFTWWDYRAASFTRNRGWRIDHHYLSPGLYQNAIACYIDTEPRTQPKPSDHAPVILEIGT